MFLTNSDVLELTWLNSLLLDSSKLELKLFELLLFYIDSELPFLLVFFWNNTELSISYSLIGVTFYEYLAVFFMSLSCLAFYRYNESRGWS